MRKLSLGILAILLVLLPFHPFLATFLNSLFFDASTSPNFFIAVWKEALILIFFLLFILQIIFKKIPFPRLDILDLFIILFIGWSIITGLLWTGGGLLQIIWGIKYGLLFLIFFFLIKHFPLTSKEKNVFFSLALASATITIVFGVVQKFLPAEFLINFGYSTPPPFGGSLNEPIAYCQKISNTEMCRTQSTFSGPNQFAAYLLFMLPVFFFLGIKAKEKMLKAVYLFTLLIGLVLMFWTFSRAAWIGIFIITIISFSAAFKDKKWFKNLAKGLGLISIILIFSTVFLVQQEVLLEGGGMFHGNIFAILHSKIFWLIVALFCSTSFLLALWQKNSVFTFFVSILSFGFFGLFAISRFFGEFFWQILLRPSSTQGHFERSADGIKYLIQNPWGLGLGDAGPASNRFATDFLGFIPENWFLQVGLESGFLGLGLFILILIILINKLIKTNNEYGLPLAIGLVGLIIHSLLLHTWESAAVAITFWGLCGIAITNEKKTPFWQKISSSFQKIILFFKKIF